MSSKRILTLEFYLFFILFSLIKEAALLFFPDSSIYLYFQFLNAFHRPISISYILSIAQVVINLLNCIPLYLSIHNKYFLNPIAWQSLLLLKIFLDVFGRPYEMKNIVSIHHSNPNAAFFILAIGILLYIPWYFFLFRYALKKNI